MDLPPHIQAPVDIIHECVVEASAYYATPPELLIAIRIQEGGAPGMMSPNKNGSFDLGPMQINTIHRSMFAGYNISMEQIRDDECTNIYAGAYIFHKELLSARGDVWRAVGNYHSRTPTFHHRYRSGVIRHYQRIKRTHGPYLTWLREKADARRVELRMAASGQVQTVQVSYEGLP